MTEKTENLQKYEELFANRFTTEDPEFQEYLSRPADPPPIVEDWRARGGGNQRGRDNRYHDRHGHRGRGWGGRGQGWGGDRGWRRDQYGQQNWQDRDQDRDRDRDRDRRWGHGSGYHSGHSSSNQGYSSHHNRQQYDRY